MIKLTHPSAYISSKLAGVYEIEFYKAGKHKNLHREKAALIELSNTNLPRDWVWQNLIWNTACLSQFKSDCLTSSSASLSEWLSVFVHGHHQLFELIDLFYLSSHKWHVSR